MSTTNTETDIAALQNELEKVKAERDKLTVLVKNYENIISMFDNALEYSRTELLGADKLVHAHETVEDLARTEQLYKDKLIRAHEGLEGLAHNELVMQDRIEQAYESTTDVARGEQIEKDKIINAHENVEDLSRDELITANKTIHDLEKKFNSLRDELVGILEAGPWHADIEKLRDENTRNFKELMSSYKKSARSPDVEVKAILDAFRKLMSEHPETAKKAAPKKK
ncbi:MAG: hypothetical protein AABZ39_16670 [Spirochaetota bacterium]